MSPATCIVFGGSSEIGEATAKKLASNGLRVIIVGRDQSRLEKARDRIGRKGGNRKCGCDGSFCG